MTVDAVQRREFLAHLTRESIDLGLYDWAPSPCCLDVTEDDCRAIRDRVDALVATAERRRADGSRFRWRAGDRVLADVEDTDGRLVVANLAVNEAAELGCGCTRLVCDRPGGGLRSNGLHLLTGCERHERE